MTLWQINSQVTKAQPQQPGTHAVRTSHAREGGKRLFWTLAVIWSSNSSWEYGQTPALLVTAAWQILSIKVIDKLFATLSNCFSPNFWALFLPCLHSPWWLSTEQLLSIKQSISSAGLKAANLQSCHPTTQPSPPSFLLCSMARPEEWQQKPGRAPRGRTEHRIQGESPHMDTRRFRDSFSSTNPEKISNLPKVPPRIYSACCHTKEYILWAFTVKTSEGTTHTSIRAPNKVLTATQVQRSFLTKKSTVYSIKSKSLSF